VVIHKDDECSPSPIGGRGNIRQRYVKFSAKRRLESRIAWLKIALGYYVLAPASLVGKSGEEADRPFKNSSVSLTVGVLRQIIEAENTQNSCIAHRLL